MILDMQTAFRNYFGMRCNGCDFFSLVTFVYTTSYLSTRVENKNVNTEVQSVGLIPVGRFFFKYYCKTKKETLN